MVGARTGGCFIMIGSDEGSGVPVSFSFISFIATENSSRSIFPSLFISARLLGDRTQNISKETVMGSQEDLLKHSILSTVSLCFSHHISANTDAGSPDWRKNLFAWSPIKRQRGKKTKKCQFTSMRLYITIWTLIHMLYWLYLHVPRCVCICTCLFITVNHRWVTFSPAGHPRLDTH